MFVERVCIFEATLDSFTPLFDPHEEIEIRQTVSKLLPSHTTMLKVPRKLTSRRTAINLD